MKVRLPGMTGACPAACRQITARVRHGFTLVEMLVVMAVIALVIGLAAPAYNALTGANNIKRAIGEIAGTLEQARAYAVANNTYAFVGIGEFDASISPDTIPQIAHQNGDQHYGRVAIAVIASKNGLLNFDSSSAQTTWDYPTGYNNGANFNVVGKATAYDNVHLIALDSNHPPVGKMGPPTRQFPSPRYELGDIAHCPCATPFTYPLGILSDNTAQNSKAKYYFARVVVFDPQGTARIIASAADVDSTPLMMEVSLQPSHGSTIYTYTYNDAIDAIHIGTEAAIQVEGMTGAVTIYRR